MVLRRLALEIAVAVSAAACCRAGVGLDATGGADSGIGTHGNGSCDGGCAPPNVCVEDSCEPPDAGAAGSCPCDSAHVCVGGACLPRGTLVNPTFASCTNPPCINVYNNCPITLWTHAIASTPIDQGNVRPLAPGAQYQYSGLSDLTGGRVYAYYQQPQTLQNPTTPVSTYNQFVEMGIDGSGPNGWYQNYDISYVDFLSLPVSVQANNGCPATLCGAMLSTWEAKLQECPTTLSNVAQGLATCAGSYNYCITPDGSSTYDSTKPYCNKMQTAHGYSGSEVYGGVFPSESSAAVSFWDQVAAWNRGTFGGDADAGDYYQTEPYNDYARWIHVELGCSAVYAFSTDDHQDQSGFIRCEAPELNILWCPYQ